MAYVSSCIPTYVKAAGLFLLAAVWSAMVALSALEYATCPEPAAKEPRPVPVVVEHYAPDYQPDPHLIVVDGMLVIAS